jgi:acyl transferase domain-containing protein
MSGVDENPGQAIALIGMAGRFPGAADLDEFWRVIEEGRDVLTRGEALRATIPKGPTFPDPSRYVAARGVLAGVEEFDAGFWGYTPKEAATLDPQHRLWLELAHEALESAGYAHDRHGQVVSVFAGSFLSSYLHGHLLPTRDGVEDFLRLQGTQSFALLVQNDPAFLPSRCAYKLNLRGPAINVQTGCSTSLVAIAQGVQSLLSYESDIALAGGVCIALPQNSGYFHQEGAITSMDGYCRPYDAKACGTVFGSGGGAVALKRLADAERDGDPIWAVIRGAALNNDGHSKVSYLAPSVAGQAEVITTAQTLAGVDPGTIGYVEGHGTATPMGDPIEVEALTQAFRRKTNQAEFCCLGSVKGNVGHLDAAAGVAGFMRAALALKRQILPPTAHFQSPNPNLRLPGSPFYVLREAKPWAPANHPRRAAVSAFGIGGTNAHLVLEEYVQPPGIQGNATYPVELRLSAKDAGALEAATKRLADYLEPDTATDPPSALCEIADTLRFRRETHAHRRSVLAWDRDDAIAALSSPERWDTGKAFPSHPKLIFAFPGQGSLRLDVLAQLFEGDPSFATHLSALASPASDLLSFDVMAFCRDPGTQPDALAADNARAQVVLYCVCVALARCLADQGIAPDACLGHSVGEWPAAHLSGQIGAEDGLVAVLHRGRLMSSTGKGAALSVQCPEDQLRPLLSEAVALACVNGDNLCLVSGRPDAIQAMAATLKEAKIRYRALPIDVAVHSPIMDAVIEPFAEILGRLSWQAPTLPMLSSVTGDYFSDSAADAQTYFANQLRAQVRFDRAIATLAREPACLVLEVGVGRTLTSLLTSGFSDPERHRAVSLLPVTQNVDMTHGLARVPGLLWAHGHPQPTNDTAPAHRSAWNLPAYPFQRKRCWVAPPAPASPSSLPIATAMIPSATRPRTVVEEVVATIADMSGLSVGSLRPELSFQALGLDSLFLVQFADRLSTVTCCPISHVRISEFNSPAKLAGYIEENGRKPHEREPQDSYPQQGTRLTKQAFRGIFCLQKGDDRVPMLMIHGDQANEMLLAHLPPEQSVYGYVHQGADGEAFQFETVEALAANCLAEWTSAKGDVPCVIAGHSYGGHVAYQLAHLLRKRGNEVLHLFILDSIHPRVLRHLYGFGPKWVWTMAKILHQRARNLAEIGRVEVYLRQGEKVPPALRTEYILAKYEISLVRHFPQPLDVETTLFSATRNMSDLPSNGYTLRDLPRMKEIRVEGNHLNIVRSPVAFDPIGKAIARRLADLREGK